MKGYGRRHLGGGNILRAVTRTRRSAARQDLGRAPGKQPGPARYKKDLRILRQIAEVEAEIEEAA
jgi:hypothetical protein